MKTELTTLAIMATAASAREINSSPSSGVMRREVPQEHSHRKIILGVKDALELNNRFNIVDPVFSLLGNAAAAEGAGDVVNLDCFQQIIADEAFTNALAIGDLVGLTNALIFRTLEKNTLTVGEQSVLCDEVANNAEIAALQQHQDPASEGADELNGSIELELARQLAAIGADPLLALDSATFEAGEIGDPTAAGNTCNDETDDVGCIFTENLARPVVSEDEILAAVADVESVDISADADADVSAEVEDVDADADADAAAANGVNIQTFAGDLGGAAPAVIQSDNERPFEVNGATFLNAGAALERSCAVQNNACANAVNSGQIEGDVGQCGDQEAACRAEAAAAKKLKMMMSKRQQNIQSFAGNLGGAAPAVIQSDNERPFEVNGATFLNAGAALQRSCAVQNNACANAVNSGQIEGDVSQCNDQEAACRAQASARLRRSRSSLSARQAQAFGSCSDPSIQFAEGLDGRNEASFAPVNAAEFNHGSANAVKIISDFICGQLGSSCDAGDDAVALCNDASAAAQAAQAEGQDGAAVAQVFNDAIGA